MKFLLDTANVDDIRKANDMGVICGVTTNPSLIAKEGRDFKQVVAEIASIVDGPISGEVKATTVDAAGMIAEVAQVFNTHGIQTEIIAASIRHPMHVTECALAGADIATVPFKVIEQMCKHPLTDQGIEKFRKDYEAVFGK